MPPNTRKRAAISEDAAHYREALEQIAGHFPPGDHPRLCYADAVTTLKMIRTESREALAGCSCVGTEDEEDCPMSNQRVQEWRLSIYRDDSETTVVFERVKHAFMTCGNTVLTIAQYAEDGSHHYINWPRERVCWWKLERAA